MADLTNKTQNLLNISVTKPATGPAAVAPGLLNNYLNNTLPGAGNKISQIRFPNAANQLATTLNNILPGAGNGIGNPTSAPPKATAAPVGNNGYMFTGLSEALNTYQNDLAKKKPGYIADIYEFEFNPTALGDSRVKNPGSTDRSKTAGKRAVTARQALDSNTVPVNNNSQNWGIQAGTQIVQLIDQIMRGSDYIRLQANTTVNSVTQQPEPSNGTGTGIVTWYNITVQATSLGWDTVRRDFAYRMKFLITPYAITKMASEYFPDSRYRGSHKSYNYWFTGKNSQILSFEQKYDHLYRLILSGQGVAQQQNQITTKYRDQYSKTPMPTTTQKTGQQTGTYTNGAPDSAADFLYSATDYAIAKVRIVGDPAWMQQGTITTGVGPQTFTFSPFNDDGSINYDSQMINFDINWNQPQDYNFDTGIMNVNDTQGRPRTNNTYIATECHSFFSRGKFEQEITGKLLIEGKPNQVVAKQQVSRPAAKVPTVTAPRAQQPQVDPPKGIVAKAEAQYREGNNVFGNKIRGVKTSITGGYSGPTTKLSPYNPNSYGNG